MINYSNLNFNGLTSYLFDYDSSFFYKVDGIGALWSSLKQIIHHSVTLFVPPKGPKHLNGPIWFTSEIRHDLHKLYSLRKELKEPNSAVTKEIVAKIESSVQNKIRETKSRFVSDLITDLAFCSNHKIYSY